MTSIASYVRSCLDLFRATIGASEVSPESPIEQTFLQTIKDEQTRFKVWAGNIGAHRTGMSSLDYRLRDSSHIRQQVIRLLGDLSGLLDDAGAIISGEEVPWDHAPGDEDPATSGEPEEEDPDTELGQISGDVTDAVNCLLRLSVAIRNPAPHDRFIESAATDTSHYEPFDIEHVRTKFSSMEAGLAERLGKAISRRRQYFKYREAHHTKLAHHLDQHHLADGDDLPQTIASSLPEHMKDGPSSAYMGQSAPLADDRSDTGVSLTSYATTVANTEQRRVPPLPDEASRGPFQCPFCYMIIDVKDKSSWKRHVFGDLRPYICVAEDCEAPDREFTKRHVWINHMKQNHWKQYQCPFSCGLVFRSFPKCQEHVMQSHAEVGASVDMGTLEMLSAQPLDMAEGLACPICSMSLASVRQYQRHVGRHQEQLALFALPSLDSADEPGHSEGEHSEASAEHPQGEPSEGGSARGGEQEQGGNNQVWEGHESAPRESGPSESTAQGNDAPVEVWSTAFGIEPNSRRGEYFIPGAGLDGEVIRHDICLYLGNDALVRPGIYKGPNNKREISGYIITSDRMIEKDMIADLIADSARWEQEKWLRTSGGADPPDYANSKTCRDRTEFMVNPNAPRFLP